MSCILHIESSDALCSVALSQDGACIYSEESAEPRSHAKRLAPLADEAISFADSHAIPLDYVAVSMGPGSYTGLRIGSSLSKGICFARRLPLLAIPTLELLCVPVLLGHDLPDDALLCPMVDARRMEVYDALFDRALKPVRETAATIVDADTYKAQLDERPIYFFGSGADKCQATIAHPNAHFIEGIMPRAKWMFPLAEKAVAQERFADAENFEPFYLKQFIAGLPKKMF